MASPISSNQTLLSVTQGLRSRQVGRSSALRPQGSAASSAASPALSRGTLSLNAPARPSARTISERQASSVLFSAANQLTQKANLESALLQGAQSLRGLALQAQNLPAGGDRDSLEQSARNLLGALDEDLQAGLAENPALASDQEFTAVIQPGGDPESSDSRFSVTISAVSSLDSLGLGSIDFSDPDAAVAQIDSAIAGLQTSLAGAESTGSAISDAVRTQGAAAQGLAASASSTDVFAKAAAIANGLTRSASQIGSAFGTLDAGRVESLISESLVGGGDAVRSAEDDGGRAAASSRRSSNRQSFRLTEVGTGNFATLRTRDPGQ